MMGRLLDREDEMTETTYFILHSRTFPTTLVQSYILPVVENDGA